MTTRRAHSEALQSFRKIRLVRPAAGAIFASAADL
jgi:hypothetical protein